MAFVLRLNLKTKQTLVGILLFVGAFLTLLSLLTYNPEDYNLFLYGSKAVVGETQKVIYHNWVGIIGVLFNHIVIYLFGWWGSLLIPFLLGNFGWKWIVNEVEEKVLSKWIGFGLGFLMWPTLISLCTSSYSQESLKYSNRVGNSLAAIAEKLIGKPGSFLVVIGLFLASAVLATELTLLDFLANLRKELVVWFEFLAVLTKKTWIVTRERIRIIKANRQFRRDLAVRNKIEEKTQIENIEPAGKPPRVDSVAPEVESEESLPKEIINQTVEKHPEIRRLKKSKNAKSASFERPPLDLLSLPEAVTGTLSANEHQERSLILEQCLRNFGVDARVVHVQPGPVVTVYELAPAPGVKINQITNLSNDMALVLKVQAVRIVAPLPGKGTIGVEVPNPQSALVTLREILESQAMKSSSSPLSVALGKGVQGDCMVFELDKMPHLLIGGATNTGKSICVAALVNSLLFRNTPNEVRLLLIDPKMVELTSYQDIPHLLVPIITDPKMAALALEWLIGVMEDRYKLLASVSVRNLESYNLSAREEGFEPLPYIVVAIDELADLMMANRKKVEDAITRLAQLARAVGIHLILATQRPSVDVITGLIKSNIPARIAFQIPSATDSRTILDSQGAEKLLGRGDMLFLPPGAQKPIRVQGAYISEIEVKKVVEFLKKQGVPDYDQTFLENQTSGTYQGVRVEKDEMYDEAVRVAVRSGQISTSMLQRKLGLGYSRAARLVDMMEEQGVVAPQEGNKPRKVLISEVPDTQEINEVQSASAKVEDDDRSKDGDKEEKES